MSLTQPVLIFAELGCPDSFQAAGIEMVVWEDGLPIGWQADSSPTAMGMKNRGEVPVFMKPMVLVERGMKLWLEKMM